MAESDEIMLGPDDAKAAWAETLRTLAARARARAEKRSGQGLAGPVTVLSLPNDSSSALSPRGRRARGRRRAARAAPHRDPAAVFFAQSPASRNRPTHEMAHLIIAERVPGRLPAWLEEGLCMTIAGQEGLGYSCA